MIGATKSKATFGWICVGNEGNYRLIHRWKIHLKNYPVSNLVNGSKTDDAGCIEPVKNDPQPQRLIGGKSNSGNFIVGNHKRFMPGNTLATMSSTMTVP